MIQKGLNWFHYDESIGYLDRLNLGDGESDKRFAWVVFWGIGIFSEELCLMPQICWYIFCNQGMLLG